MRAHAKLAIMLDCRSMARVGLLDVDVAELGYLQFFRVRTCAKVLVTASPSCAQHALRSQRPFKDPVSTFWSQTSPASWWQGNTQKVLLRVLREQTVSEFQCKTSVPHTCHQKEKPPDDHQPIFHGQALNRVIIAKYLYLDLTNICNGASTFKQHLQR